MKWWEWAVLGLALLVLGWFAVGHLVRAVRQTAGSVTDTYRRLRELFR
ncbi:hypothetical protein [Streptomyces catenulae]|uniref:Uncharacterized protein n=1 Tax=Streptomyces catenulae TaxID=66875 RepID=A0ABV2Z858_9ACTN|nr:hypothetical protein [Streptomyces catenulae]